MLDHLLEIVDDATQIMHLSPSIEFQHGRAYLNNRLITNEKFDFISDGTWFVESSKCLLVDNCGSLGAIFSGSVDNDEMKSEKDEELCGWEEFDIYDKSGNLVLKHLDG